MSAILKNKRKWLVVKISGATTPRCLLARREASRESAIEGARATRKQKVTTNKRQKSNASYSAPYETNHVKKQRPRLSSRRELVPSGSRLEKKRLYDSDDDDDDDDDGSDDERVLNAVPDDDDDDDEGVTPNAISTGPRRSPRLVKLATSFSDTQLTPEENTESETEPQTPSDEFTAETLNIDVQTLHDIIEESSDIGNAVKDEARKKLAAYRNENTSIAVVGHLGQGKSYTINCLVAPKSFLLKHSSGAQVGFAPLRSKRGGQSCTTTPVVIDKDPSNSDSFSISYVRYTLSDEKDKSKNPTLVSKTEEPVKSNLTFTEACDLLEGLSDTDHGRDTVLHLQGPFSLPDKITLYDTPGIGDDPEQDGPYITPLMRHLLCEADVLAIVSQRAASREEVSALIKRGALSGVFTKAESKTPVVLSIYRADEYDSENDLSLARKQIVRAIDRLITDQEVIAGVEFEDDKLRLVDMIRRNIQVFSSSQLDEGHDRAVRCLNNVRACSLTNISVAVLTSTASMLFSHLKVAASATNYANPGKSINKRWNKLVTKLGYGAKATALHESTKALSALDDAAERLFEYFEQDPDVLCSPGHSAKTIVHYARGFLTHTCVRLVVQSVVDTFLRFAEGLRTDDGKPTSEDGDAEDGLFAAFVLDEDTLREKLEATVFDMSVCSQTVLADFVKLFAAHEDAEARRSVLPIEAERTFKAIVSDKKQALFESVRQFLGESREKLLSTIKAASADRTREEKDKVREQISQLKTMIRKIQRRPTGEQMAENMPRQDPHVIVDELRKHAAECNTKPLIKRLPSDSTAASSTGNELLTQSVKPLLVATKETERATEGIPECLSCLHSSIAIVSASASPVGVAGKMSVSGWTFCGPIASLQSHIRPTAGKAATPPIMSILTPNGLLSKVKIINLLFGDNALTPTSRSVFLIVDAHFPKLAEIAEAISERVNSATTQWPKLGFLVITGPGSRDMIATSDMCTNAMRFFASGALNTELFWYLEPGILGMTPVWNSRGLYSVATPLDSALDRTERDWFAIVMAKEKSQRLSVAKLSTRLEVDVEKPDEGLELLETILVDNAKKHPQFREWKRTIQAVNRAASKSPLQVITAFVECVRHLSEFIVASESSEHKALRAVVDDILSVDNIDKQLVAIGWVPSPFQVHTILQASPKMFRFARNYRGGSTTQNTAQLRGAVLFNTRALQNHYAGQSSTGSRTTPVGVSDVDWEDSVVESRRRFLQNMFKKTSSLAVMISFCMAPAYVKAHGPLNAPRRRSSPKKPKKRLKKT